ncbi:MAG TPA: hypothetical protein DCX06_14215 [Opitutae bacterium]|nr:hypothetical protein [Opitutae bacterium]
MKLLALFSTSLLASALSMQAANYSLFIGDKEMDLHLNEEVRYTTEGGEELTIKVTQKEYVTFNSDFFSIKHKNLLQPAKTDLGDGIQQTMLMSPLGCGVLVQEYKSMDPSALIDLMAHELTKEEVSYGYKKEEETGERKIGEHTLNGKVVYTRYNDEEWKREFYAYGSNDKGVLIVTMVEKEEYETDGYIIEDFWKTLTLSVK